jgi:hypothetical protein
VQAASGDVNGTFDMNFEANRWTSATAFEEGDFPFIAELRGRRYELYSDGTFNEQEVT